MPSLSSTCLNISCPNFAKETWLPRSFWFIREVSFVFILTPLCFKVSLKLFRVTSPVWNFLMAELSCCFFDEANWPSVAFFGDFWYKAWVLLMLFISFKEGEKSYDWDLFSCNVLLMSFNLVWPATGFFLKRDLNSGVARMPICDCKVWVKYSLEI